MRTASAQVLFGSLVGSVTDASGAAIPGAAVTVTHIETNEGRDTLTTPAGGYSLSTVRAGISRISMKKDGFKVHSVDNVLISLNTVARLDATLQVGAHHESQQVTAISAPLQTEKADVHIEFNARQLVDLPLPTRNFEGIIALTPGMAPPVTNGGGTNNPSKSFQVTANGTSRSGTNVMIDGISATNPWVQSFPTYTPSVEAIESVNVVTGSSSAEQGLTNGASIIVQTKSGTNDLHGLLFEYNIVSALKARGYFLPATPKLIENDFGGTLGGKIVRNKLFYFGSYEGNYNRLGSNRTVTVPTPAIRQGNMSASVNPIYDPASGVYDARGIPTGRVPFPGNIIPAHRIDAASAKLVLLLPDPNQNISANPSNNHFVGVPISNTLTHIDTKFDWVASQKWRFTGRYGYQPYNLTQPAAFGDILGGPSVNIHDGYATAYAVNMTYVASPRLVVDANWGRTYAHQTLSPPSTDKKLGSEYLGIPGTNLGDLPYSGGMPQFNIEHYSSYGFSISPLQYDDPVYQYSGNATWSKGSHNLRFGMSTSRQHMAHIETTPTRFDFNGGATLRGQGVTANAFNTYADFLLGLPQRFVNSRAPNTPITLRTWQHSLYIQDTWQVHRKVTFTVGTAWEYYPVPTRGDRQIETYDFGANRIILCGIGPNRSNCGITVQKTLFAPRIGIAYRPAENTVIRAGYTLAPEQINLFRDGLYNYPTRPDFDQRGLSAFSPVGSLATGIPEQAQPDLSGGILTPPRGLVLSAIILPNEEFIRGYTQSMNLTLQRDFGDGWIGQVGYVGTLTIHQHTRYNVNYGTLNGGTASQVFAAQGITAAMTVILPYETMRYNSLQARLDHRFSKGLLFGAAFTRSKWLGTCCDDSGDGGPAISLPQYTHLNRAIMGADRPNNLRISAVYDLPFGRGRKFAGAGGLLSSVAGGWHVQSVFSKYSGTPFSASGGNINTPGFTQRAQQVKTDVRYFGNIGPGQSYFDGSAFVAVTTPGVIGNAGFNTLRGPGVTNIDLSAFRDFQVGEHFMIQFRAEALNATNTPHFANPNGNTTAFSYTQITATTSVSRLLDERYLRFALRIRL